MVLKYEEGVSDGTTLAVVVKKYFLQANFVFAGHEYHTFKIPTVAARVVSSKYALVGYFNRK